MCSSLHDDGWLYIWRPFMVMGIVLYPLQLCSSGFQGHWTAHTRYTTWWLLFSRFREYRYSMGCNVGRRPHRLCFQSLWASEKWISHYQRSSSQNWYFLLRKSISRKCRNLQRVGIRDVLRRCKIGRKKKYWALLLGYERRNTTLNSWISAKQQTLVLLKQMGDGMERRICMGLILMDFGCGSFKRVAYFEKFDAGWPPETRDVVIW